MDINTNPQDTIFVRNLTFDTIIGVLPEERTKRQPIIINLEVGVDIRPAAESKDLSDTLDYASLAEQVKAFTIAAECLLVETLAEDIAALTLTRAQAQNVLVEINKPNALADADSVGVRIYRTR
jgi:dihydroneopterin aldolase